MPEQGPTWYSHCAVYLWLAFGLSHGTIERCRREHTWHHLGVGATNQDSGVQLQEKSQS